ncbi:MAG: restriction endonuclease [Bacteroidales bacterium]|jgi:Holliday junction resolvase-like predicted endonuclease|nr:restriction endonuclease [Bacteroidales bacterium]OPZ97967.1 MAG: hypothetical protein BWY72_01029 [Bacteroidetes bacterium ADurb.Bin416]HBL73503.1 ATP-binding protein [Bacteroidales bacterium]
MKKNLLIRKQTGELEPFSQEKLVRSLVTSGATEDDVHGIIEDVESWFQDGMSSRKVYNRAFQLLKRNKGAAAARYKLKKAMMELGPTGYPFEILVGEVYHRLGYEVKVGQTLQGHCVTHEVDVVARKGNDLHFIECKYYQHTGKNANVQVPLYIRSRVDDLIRHYQGLPEYADVTFHGGIATNTRFTTDAISFGECTGLNLVSWDYPQGRGLKELIDLERIFPITVLTKLQTAEKQALLNQDIVLCRQLGEDISILTTIGMDEHRIKKVAEEIRSLCCDRPQ